jgi:hypothetical protein
MKMFERHKIRGIRRVSKKEAGELSKLPWVLDEALSDDTWEARVLPDGRALHLLRIDGAGNLYPSREALAQVVQQLNEDRAKARNGGGRFDPAKELLPPLDEFIRDVEKHAKGVGKVLRISDEALDRSVESLDLVDKAVSHLRIAKRMTPEVFTPLTAYLGEVMRLVCDGRWGRLPAAIKKRRPVYDPAEYAAWAAADNAVNRAAGAAAAKAAEDATARGAGDRAASDAFHAAGQAVRVAMARSIPPAPAVLRWEEYEEAIAGHEHEPVIWAHDRALISPVAALVRTLTERSTYGSLRTAVDGRLSRYVIAKREADRPEVAPKPLG